MKSAVRNNLCRFVLLCVLCGLLFINLPSSGIYAYAGEAIKSHKNINKKIALTFDDGPHPVYTKRILDILAQYNVSATFFLIGENAVRSSDMICRIIDEGHEIGNHTWSHRLTWKLGRDAIIYELNKTERVICEVSDFRPKLFRPPDGRNSVAITQAAKEMDYRVILWTIDTRDWEPKTKSADIISNITSNVHSGSIILCHDFVTRTDSVTPDAIATVIPLLLERGYRFVTVSELIYSS